jgi:hypothetical protein
MDKLKNMLDTSIDSYPTSKLKLPDNSTSETETFPTKKLKSGDISVLSDKPFHETQTDLKYTTTLTQQISANKKDSLNTAKAGEKRRPHRLSLAVVILAAVSILFLYVLSRNMQKTNSSVNLNSSGVLSPTERDQDNNRISRSTEQANHKGIDNEALQKENIPVYEGTPSLVYTPDPAGHYDMQYSHKKPAEFPDKEVEVSTEEPEKVKGKRQEVEDMEKEGLEIFETI